MTAGLGPRTWRAAFIVFLAVFLGGMGVSGASALWSQQATTSAGLSTGHWKDTSTTGWSVPMTVELHDVSYELLTRRHTATITWMPTEDSDRIVPELEYVVEVVNPGNDGTVHSVGQVVAAGDTRSVRIHVQRDFLRITDFTVAITPVFNGASGAPEIRTMRAIAWDLYFD